MLYVPTTQTHVLRHCLCFTLRYSHVKQCYDNYRIPIINKPLCSKYIFAHFDTKFASILLV